MLYSVDLIVNTLSPLEHLHHARFHDDVSGFSNPVCEHALYRRTVVDSLTSLVTLDGTSLHVLLTEINEFRFSFIDIVARRA